MKQQEAFNKITREHKWYVGVYSQGYASQIIQRFNAGQLKQSTIEAFLNKFGYVKIQEATYKKADGKPNNLKTK